MRWLCAAIAALALMLAAVPVMADGAHAGEVVVLLHGVHRRAGSMRRIARALEAEGFAVINESYPSLRLDIFANAERLARRLEEVPAERIHFVTHSMGGLLARQLMSAHPSRRYASVVMIAPPNQGAALADRYRHLPFFGFVMGRAALQLCTGEDALCRTLPPPPVPFIIFAGHRGHPRGWHPLIPGDDDGTVGVSETYLPGAAAFVTVRASHTFIMNHPAVIAGTVRFLTSGRLDSPADTEPQ